MKCTNCGSESFIPVPSITSVQKKYQKEESGCTRSYRRDYRIRKRLCLECGLSYEFMEKEDLDLLLSERQYELN